MTIRGLLLTSAQAGMAEQIRAGLADAFPTLPMAYAADATEAVAHIETCDILLTFGAFLSDDLLQRARSLKWIQSLGSGVDGIADRPTLPADVLLTSGRGAQAHPVSETALAFMFALGRDFTRLRRNQDERRWQRWAPALLRGKRVVIVGLGTIAEVLAEKCRVLGMCVEGVSRRGDAVPGFDRVHPRSDLAEAASAADYLVLLTPYDASTHHLVDATVLSRMRPTAFLINVARGAVVDESSLVDALQRGAIAGAGLDVFAVEPLPSHSPLWSLPNVIVSPHMAGLNQGYAAELLPILITNIRAFLNGDQGSMLNTVPNPRRRGVVDNATNLTISQTVK